MKNFSFIGLGSNLNKPLEQVQNALLCLNKHKDIRICQCSSWYRNPAVGPGIQPDYINGVAEINTQLTAKELLHALQQIEQQFGRVRSDTQWQARTLDLDILLFNQAQIQQTDLLIPHPRIYERAFVLYPLNELAPALKFPDGTLLSTRIQLVSDKALEKITISR